VTGFPEFPNKLEHRLMLTSGTVSETYATTALAEVAISPL
jgi:hypothetical protein